MPGNPSHAFAVRPTSHPRFYEIVDSIVSLPPFRWEYTTAAVQAAPDFVYFIRY